MPEDIDHRRSSLNQEDNLGPRRLSPSKGCSNKSRWDIPYSKTRTSPLSRRNFFPETRPTNSQHLSPGHRLPEGRAYSTDTESHFSLGYGAISRPLDHRIGSPDRLIHGLSTQRFPTSHEAQSTNGDDEVTILECKWTISSIRLKVQQYVNIYTLASVVLFHPELEN